MKYQDAQKIIQWASDLDGVFSMSDLKVLFSETTEPTLYKKLNGLIRQQLLVKVLRGLYATPGTPLDVISNRINPDSYVSTGTILARNMVIGSVPKRKLQAVKVGRPRTYTFELGTIEHLSIAPALFCGFNVKNGIKVAEPEKAFLDACYFFYKGKRFSFDLDTDVNQEALNPERIKAYLQKYDPKFVSFFRRKWTDE